MADDHRADDAATASLPAEGADGPDPVVPGDAQHVGETGAPGATREGAEMAEIRALECGQADAPAPDAHAAVGDSAQGAAGVEPQEQPAAAVRETDVEVDVAVQAVQEAIAQMLDGVTTAQDIAPSLQPTVVDAVPEVPTLAAAAAAVVVPTAAVTEETPSIEVEAHAAVEHSMHDDDVDDDVDSISDLDISIEALALPVSPVPVMSSMIQHDSDAESLSDLEVTLDAEMSPRLAAGTPLLVRATSGGDTPSLPSRAVSQTAHDSQSSPSSTPVLLNDSPAPRTIEALGVSDADGGSITLDEFGAVNIDDEDQASGQPAGQAAGEADAEPRPEEEETVPNAQQFITCVAALRRFGQEENTERASVEAIQSHLAAPLEEASIDCMFVGLRRLLAARRQLAELSSACVARTLDLWPLTHEEMLNSVLRFLHQCDEYLFHAVASIRRSVEWHDNQFFQSYLEGRRRDLFSFQDALLQPLRIIHSLQTLCTALQGHFPHSVCTRVHTIAQSVHNVKKLLEVQQQCIWKSTNTADGLNVVWLVDLDRELVDHGGVLKITKRGATKKYMLWAFSDMIMYGVKSPTGGLWISRLVPLADITQVAPCDTDCPQPNAFFIQFGEKKVAFSTAMQSDRARLVCVLCQLCGLPIPTDMQRGLSQSSLTSRSPPLRSALSAPLTRSSGGNSSSSLSLALESSLGNESNSKDSGLVIERASVPRGWRGDSVTIVNGASIPTLIRLMLEPLPEFAHQDIPSIFFLSVPFFSTVSTTLEVWLQTLQTMQAGTLVPPAGRTEAQHVALSMTMISLLQRWVSSPFGGDDFSNDAARRAVDAIAKWMEQQRNPRVKDEMDALVAEVSRAKPVVETKDDEDEEAAKAQPKSGWGGLFKSLLPKKSAPKAGVKVFSDPTLTPAQVAAQLTVRDVHALNKIASREMMRYGCGDENCKRMRRLIDAFDRLSFWVGSEILQESYMARERSQTIDKWISIAEQCVDMFHNFNSCFAIINGLQAPYIKKLATAWELVPRSQVDKFTALCELVNSSGNFRNYRKALGKCGSTPCIPSLSVSLKDVSAAKIGTAKPSGEGLVHFGKWTQMAHCTSELLQPRFYPGLSSDPDVEMLIVDGTAKAYGADELGGLATAAAVRENAALEESLEEAGFF